MGRHILIFYASSITLLLLLRLFSLSCVYNDKCQQKKIRKSFDFDTEMDVGKLLKKKKTIFSAKKFKVPLCRERNAQFFCFSLCVRINSKISKSLEYISLAYYIILLHSQPVRGEMIFERASVMMMMMMMIFILLFTR